MASSITMDTPNTTPATASAAHRASDGAAQVLHSLNPQPSTPPARNSPKGTAHSHAGEGVQHSAMSGHAQFSSGLEANTAQHSSTLGDVLQSTMPPTPPNMLEPCRKLAQAVSKVLACASVRQQEQHSSDCLSNSGQNVEPRSLTHSATPAAQTACHTVTLASLEQAARSQAPDAPLALLVLGDRHGSWKPWNSSDDDGTEQAAATKQLQGSSSTTQQTCKDEMGSCVWLNSAFSSHLEAPSKQAALATTNQSISRNLTIQRHIAGFCRNMELRKQDPICFWSLFNPMAGSAQVERICMWPCELLVNEGSCTSHQGIICRAILISIAGWVSRDMQYDVLLHQHMAYQFTPCMVTVLSTEGCILTQNAESVAWLGCHSKEHSIFGHGAEDLPPRVPHQSKEAACEPSQPFCYLKELFYNQEDLLMEMLKVVGEQEPFVERMEIKSPLLRAWLGAGEDEEVWHRVHIIRSVDPITHQPQYCLSQMDVTDVIQAEQHVLQLQQQQQGALLKEILPQQVVERLLVHKSDLVKSVPKKLSPKANPTAVPPLPDPFHRKPPTPPAAKGKSDKAHGYPLLPSLDETRHGEQGVECHTKPSESTQRMSCSSSARRAMRSLQDLTKENLASQSMIPKAQAPRSMSLEKLHNGSPPNPSIMLGSPPNPSTMFGRLSLQETPVSLDASRTSLTHNWGQQQVDPEQALLSQQSIQSSHSASCAGILSPRASGSELPSHQTQPEQDATLGMTWLTQQDVMDLATFHDNVTILFADIKGFTSMVNQLHPSQVMLFLNSLYSVWDSLLETYGVYKIETIGDCYMCCSGLFCYDEATSMKRLGGHDPQHARTMLEFAKAMIWSSQKIKTPFGDTVQVRVGIHSGSCSSGVVGQRMPRWCLFGDSVNTANRMESNGIPGCIHASEATVKMLEGEPWRSTGGIVAKGKGLMQTSLLPILPGAAHAAALFIAQRHSTSGAASEAGVISSAPQLESIDAEATLSDGQLQLGVTGPQSSASAGAPHCPDESLMLERAELLRTPAAAAPALPAMTAAPNVPDQIFQSCHGCSPERGSLAAVGKCSATQIGEQHTHPSRRPGSTPGTPPDMPAMQTSPDIAP